MFLDGVELPQGATISWLQARCSWMVWSSHREQLSAGCRPDVLGWCGAPAGSDYQLAAGQMFLDGVELPQGATISWPQARCSWVVWSSHREQPPLATGQVRLKGSYPRLAAQYLSLVISSFLVFVEKSQ